MKHNPPQPDASGDSTQPPATGASSEGSGEPTSRRLYRQPQLRRLGSVRELTLGGTGFLVDGGTTRRRTM